ncbi:MAG: bifunctional non-ous end joining protein LigD [Acidimicrobiaceae bacterium]|jgi:bifunctional non-homologous end joining protein LigD
MNPKLEEYQAKRDFKATPEPAGAVEDADQHRFVIQQHSATRLHWDLRLEHDGVLVSWALPRGVPWNPKENHLAVHTEDHPMQYLDFHGEIPEGSYGAGTMFVWDTGTYDIEEWEDRKAVVVLHGQKVRGKYALFATRGRDWMIHRMDPPEDPTRRPPPRDLRPMWATKGPRPKTKGWALEVEWTGVRALLVNEPGLTTMTDADGTDISAAFPEIRRIGRALGAEEVILDGVITSSAGREALDRRLAAKSDSTVRRMARDQPAVYVAFDLIWHEGHECWDDEWRARRARLDALDLGGDHWKVPTAHVGDGAAAIVEAARSTGVEALVAKRVRSRYTPGVESDDWVEFEL